MSKGNLWLTSLMILTVFFGKASCCGSKRVACLDSNAFQFCFRTRFMVFLVGNVKYCPKGTVCDENIGLSPCVKQDNTYELTTDYPRNEITPTTEIPTEIAPSTEIPQFITSLSEEYIETLSSNNFIEDNSTNETIEVKLPNYQTTSTTTARYVAKPVEVTESAPDEENQISYEESNTELYSHNYVESWSGADYFIDDNVLDQSDDERVELVKVSNEQTTITSTSTTVAEEKQKIYEEPSTELYLNTQPTQPSIVKTTLSTVQTTASTVKTTPCIKYYLIKYKPQISYKMENKITNFVLNKQPENKLVYLSNNDSVPVIDQDKIIVNKPASDQTSPAENPRATTTIPEVTPSKIETYQTPRTESPFIATFQYKLLPSTLKTIQTIQTEKVTTAAVTTSNLQIESKQEIVPKCTGRGTHPSSKCNQYYECVQILWWYNLKIKNCGLGRRYDVTVLTCVTDVSCKE